MNKKPNDAIRFTADIQSSFKRMKVITVSAVIFFALSVVGVVALSFKYSAEQKGDRIYVLDEGSVLAAKRADNAAQKDLEVKDHLRRFHELFFNVSPNTETINRNISDALNLTDDSAYNYFSDLKAHQFYTRLIQNGAVQNAYVDSVKMDIMSYPYLAKVYMSRYYIRESSVTKYAMVTSCQLVEVPRSELNPHGLQIQKFNVDSETEIGTRRR